MSLLRKVLTQYVKSGQNRIAVEVPLLKARTTEDILSTFASQLIKAFTASPAQVQDIVDRHLRGTHFIFDRERYAVNGEVLSANWLLDEVDMEKIFSLPRVLSAEKQRHIVILLTEFQNILFPAESYQLLKAIEKLCRMQDKSVSLIFTGTRLNAMREIFDVHKWFYGYVEKFFLEPMKTKEIVNYYYHGFQQTGKVIEKDIILNVTQILRGNMWYLSHLFCIMDQMCHGYVNKNMATEALDTLTSIHQPRFFANVCSLTDFQLQMLRAIIDGEKKLSAADVIDKYGLHSSANVKRLRDALVKKEIVWFDEGDIPHIQDPLFELWLRKTYFRTDFQ